MIRIMMMFIRKKIIEKTKDNYNKIMLIMIITTMRTVLILDR